MSLPLIQRTLPPAALSLLCALVLALGLSLPPTAVRLLADTQPLVMTGTFTSRPGTQYVAMAMDNYVKPTRPGDYLPAIPLTTPEQAWPITGLFDYTFGRSVSIGLADLERDVAEQGLADPIVIFGYSQSAVISTEYKRRLAAAYPGMNNPAAPDISFVLIGNLNRPNGGVMTRFQGAYIPLINFYFNGPAPTDTSFDTVDIARQYDGFADFPLYPLNVVSTANALLGILYVHTDYQGATLAPTPPLDTRQGTFGDSTYYLIPTAQLPLLQPLRDLGVPEPLVALVEPSLRELVELGYDREIDPWVPTRARLFGPVDLAAVAGDLAQAWQQGVDDAVVAIENPTPPQPGPTPTVRVLSDLVRLNIDHTLGALTGDAAAESEPSAQDEDSGDSAPRKPGVQRTLRGDLPTVRDVVTSVRDRLLGRNDSATTDSDEVTAEDDGADVDSASGDASDDGDSEDTEDGEPSDSSPSDAQE